LEVPRGTVCLGFAADCSDSCSDSKGLLSASMGRNITFKKRRYSYKAALALEIKMRGIVTNFVVYYRIELQLASCIANLLLARVRVRMAAACATANPGFTPLY
jgi:hypothetical protein